MRRLTILGAAALAVAVAGTAAGATKLTLKSSAFVNGAQLPAKYSCDGDNVSPPLAWTGVPKGTKELAVLVDDPDAPGGTFTHWITWGISPKVRGLGEGKAGPTQGRNDGGRVGYAGACPPRGSPHRYVFRLYALKAKLGLARGATRAQFDGAIRGKVIARAQLVGLFAR